jgi:hypothetical protein
MPAGTTITGFENTRRGGLGGQIYKIWAILFNPSFEWERQEKTVNMQHRKPKFMNEVWLHKLKKLTINNIASIR